MKKAITIIALLIGLAGSSQNLSDLKNFHKQYLEYCNTIVGDTTVTQTADIKTKRVPIWSCGALMGYTDVITDTIWGKPEVIYYQDDLNWPRDYNSFVISSSVLREYYSDTKQCKPPTRQVTGKIKREKPSQEGFYTWLYKKLK